MIPSNDSVPLVLGPDKVTGQRILLMMFASYVDQNINGSGQAWVGKIGCLG